MANCQNNMRYGRQGTPYQNNRPSYNMSRQVSGRMPQEQRGNINNRSYALRESQSSCGCGKKNEDALAGLPLAMAYVPWQRWGKIYDVEKALQQGTIFESLDKPFLGRGGCNR